MRNDYNISSHFEANDEITTNFNFYHGQLFDNYVSSYWVINNEDSVAEIQNHSETLSEYMTPASVTMFGNETTYALINIPVPDNLKYLFHLGLVSKVSFTANAQSQARTINFAVGVAVQSAQAVPTNDRSLTGNEISGTTLLTQTAETASFSSYNYIVAHMYVYVPGYLFGTAVDVIVSNLRINITLSSKPQFYVGLSTPNTPGASGNRSTLYSSVTYNDTLVAKDSWTMVSFDKFGDTFDLVCSAVNRYPAPVWRYGKTNPSLHSAFGTAYTVSQTLTLNLYVFATQNYGGQGMYYGAYYGVPQSYTLTLIAPEGHTFISGLSGWTYNGNSISRTIYYDNDFTLPLANQLFTETGSFAGWYISDSLAYGNGATIPGHSITSNITLVGKSGAYDCLNPTVGEFTYDVNETLLRDKTTTGTASFSVSQEPVADTHYVNVYITYLEYYESLLDKYTLEGVYAIYASGPLTGITVTLDKTADTRKWVLPYCCGNFYIYSSWSVSSADIFTATFNGNNGTPATQTRTYWYGRGIPASEMPIATRTDKLFGGWYDSQGNLFTQISPTYRGNVQLTASWIDPAITTSHSLTMSSGEVSGNWTSEVHEYTVNVPANLTQWISSGNLYATVEVTGGLDIRAKGNNSATGYTEASFENPSSFVTVATATAQGGGSLLGIINFWGDTVTVNNQTATIATQRSITSNSFKLLFRARGKGTTARR